MSRSYKRNGWCTDGADRASSGTHFYKKRANKKARRFNGEMPTKGKFHRKLTNPWDIHDFIVEARPKGSESTAYKDWMK